MRTPLRRRGIWICGILMACVAVGAAIIGSLVFIRPNVQGRGILIDASRPLSMTSPMQTVTLDGQWVLMLPPDVGNGWQGKGGGEARYIFHCARAGDYYVWAEALWINACGNAVFVSANGGPRVIVGNDPVFDKWHWVRGARFPLRQGSNDLVVSNHDAGIALRRFFLTDSSVARPGVGSNEHFAHVFYEDFNGCAHGSFSLWKSLSGKWEIVKSDRGRGPTDNALKGSADGAMAFIALPHPPISRHVVNLQFRASDLGKGSEGGIYLLGEKNGQEYRIQWQSGPNPQTVLVRVLDTTGEDPIPVMEFAIPWDSQAWHEVKLELRDGNLGITIDGQEERSCSLASKVIKELGLFVFGDAVIYCDDFRTDELAEASERTKQ